MQGNFLSPAVQDEVKKFLKGFQKGTTRSGASWVSPNDGTEDSGISDMGLQTYLEQEKQSGVLAPASAYHGSDLCNAALKFGFDTLRPSGHFICKFYQGSEDKAFETRLKLLFAKVHREKPESSRTESKEAYFVALRRKSNVEPAGVFG
ncbi:MAG: hypothetical protein Q9222_000633 [Ikaeria aurantiellina]